METVVTENRDLLQAIREHIDNRRYSEAEREIAVAIHSTGTDSARLFAALAEIRNLQCDFESAEGLAEKSLEKLPGNPEGRFQLASAWFGRQEIEKAAALFEELEPEMEHDARFLAQRSRFFRQRHDLRQALEYAVRAANLAPKRSEYHALKARMLLAQQGISRKQIQQAREAASKAKQLDRTSSEAWKMLIRATLASGAQQEFFKAIQAARKALPGSPDIETEVAEYLVIKKEYAEAEATLQKVLQKHKKCAPAYQVLAKCYIETQQWEQAVNTAYQALGFEPYALRTWKLIGSALAGNEEPDHALPWLHKALLADPDDLSLAAMFADVLRKLHEFDAAEDLYRQIFSELGGEPGPQFLQAYALLLTDMERNTEAVALYRRAYALLPDDPVLQMNLATALTNAGEFQEARDLYQKMIDHYPGAGEAYLYYTSITKMDQDDEFIGKVNDNIDLVTDQKQKEAMYYALAKCYEDKRDFENAFNYLSAACALHKERCGYNEKANLEGLNLIASIFSEEFIRGLQGCGSESVRPIFVLGMPRSGTTLVEQILSSHPEIVGGGELFFMDTVLRNHAALVEGSRVGSLSQLTCEQVSVSAEEYLSLISPVGPADKYIVDKMPHNFLHIGLIHLMYPNAKIIHVKRDPMATCFSCFKQRFTEGHSYSFNLEDLGRYYLTYLHLMEHWNRVLPGRIFQVEYETLTGDFEQQVRDMIAYCGLEWDDACLEFHKSKRSVRTASLAQVRKPIYTDSVSFWRNYEEQLKPLSDILRAGGAI